MPSLLSVRAASGSSLNLTTWATKEVTWSLNWSGRLRRAFVPSVFKSFLAWMKTDGHFECRESGWNTDFLRMRQMDIQDRFYHTGKALSVLTQTVSVQQDFIQCWHNAKTSPLSFVLRCLFKLWKQIASPILNRIASQNTSYKNNFLLNRMGTQKST